MNSTDNKNNGDVDLDSLSLADKIRNSLEARRKGPKKR